MVPMMPLAPGRLSMMTACFVFSSICLPISRAVISPEPPGPNGTMIRIGRDGKEVARTAPGMKALPISARRERRSIRLVCMERASVAEFFLFLLAKRGFRGAVMFRFGGVSGFLAERSLFIVTPLLVESRGLFAARPVVMGLGIARFSAGRF